MWPRASPLTSCSSLMRTKCSCASVSLPVPNETWGERSQVGRHGERNNFLFLLRWTRTKCDLIFLKNDLKFLACYTNTPISCGYKIHTFPTPRDLPDSFFPFQCFSQSCLRSRHLSQQQLCREYLLSWASPPPTLLSPNIPVPVQHETSPVPRPCSQLSACFFHCFSVLSVIQSSPNSKPLSSVAPYKYTWPHILRRGLPFPLHFLLSPAHPRSLRVLFRGVAGSCSTSRFSSPQNSW